MSKKKIVAMGAVRSAVGGAKVPISAEKPSKTMQNTRNMNVGQKGSTMRP